MPKKETLIWTCLALADRTELFYSFSHKDEAIFTDETIDEISECLALEETIGQPGRIDGTREIAISDNIVLVFDQVKKQIRILQILFAKALLK